MRLQELVLTLAPRNNQDSGRRPSHSCYRGLAHYHLPRLGLQTQPRQQKKPDIVCVFCWITFTYFHGIWRLTLWLQENSEYRCRQHLFPQPSVGQAAILQHKALQGSWALFQGTRALGWGRGTRRPQRVPWRALAGGHGLAEARFPWQKPQHPPRGRGVLDTRLPVAPLQLGDFLAAGRAFGSAMPMSPHRGGGRRPILGDGRRAPLVRGSAAERHCRGGREKGGQRDGACGCALHRRARQQEIGQRRWAGGAEPWQDRKGPEPNGFLRATATPRSAPPPACAEPAPWRTYRGEPAGQHTAGPRGAAFKAFSRRRALATRALLTSPWLLH